MYMEYGKEWRLCSNICILFGMLLLRWAILSNWVMTFCLMVKRRHWTKKVENHCIRVPDRSMNNLSTASHPESLCCWCAGLRIHLKQEVVLDYFGWHEPWEYFWISSGYVWRFESIKVCHWAHLDLMHHKSGKGDSSFTWVVHHSRSRRSVMQSGSIVTKVW